MSRLLSSLLAATLAIGAGTVSAVAQNYPGSSGRDGYNPGYLEEQQQLRDWKRYERQQQWALERQQAEERRNRWLMQRSNQGNNWLNRQGNYNRQGNWPGFPLDRR